LLSDYLLCTMFCVSSSAWTQDSEEYARWIFFVYEDYWWVYFGEKLKHIVFYVDTQKKSSLNIFHMKWKKYFNHIEILITQELNKFVDFATMYSIRISRDLQIHYLCQRKWWTCDSIIFFFHLIELHLSPNAENCQILIYFRSNAKYTCHSPTK
jgi:hypothetical protein